MPVPALGVPKRASVKILIVATSVFVVAAVVVAVVLMGGSGSGSPKSTESQTPAGPIGTDQGFGASDPDVPSVTAKFDQHTNSVRFTWRSTLPNATFVYSINGGPTSPPSPATSITVPTSNPTATCITVSTVVDGALHRSAQVCG
jgi:hypothetical protein